MSVATAKAALAARLLNKPTSPQGAVRVDALLYALKEEGHSETDFHAALFELKEDGLVQLEERTDRRVHHNLLGQVLTNIPPTVTRYEVVWPLPPLSGWWKSHATAPQAPPTARDASQSQGSLSPPSHPQNALRLVAAIDEFIAAIHLGGSVSWETTEIRNLTGEIQALGKLLDIPVEYSRLHVEWGEHSTSDHYRLLSQHRGYLTSLRRMAEVLAEHAKLSANLAGSKRGQEDKTPDTQKKKRNRAPKDIAALLALKRAIDRGAKKGQSMRESAIEHTDGDEKRADTLLRTLRRHKDHPSLN